MARTDLGTIGVLFAIAALTTAPSARAEEPASETRASADALFDEGKLLEARGDVGQACAKYELSHGILPRGGTALHWASCVDRLGDRVQAWNRYREALDLARKDGRTDRAQVAEARITALAAELGFLEIALAGEAPNAETVVSLDGRALALAELSERVPVLPGEHTVTVAAQERKPFEVKVFVTASATKRIEVPALEKASAPAAAPIAPAAPPVAPAPAAPPRAPSRRIDSNARPSDGEATEPGPTSTTRTVGWIVGAVGIATLGVGSYFGLRAFSKKATSDDALAEGRCSDACFDAWEDGRDAASISNVAFAVGALATGVGLYLVLSSGESAREAEPASGRTLEVRIRAARGDATLGFGGSW